MCSNNLDSLVRKLNPNFLKGLDISSFESTDEVSAIKLLRPERFDLLAKIIYGRDRKRGLNTDWAKNLYLEHLRAFNRLEERDGSGKVGAMRFLSEFNSLLDSVAESGLDARKSVVPLYPGDILGDGAHRVAAAIVHGCDVPVAKFSRGSHCFDERYFLRKGLARHYLDAMAYELIRSRKDLYVAVVFPSAVGKDERLEALIHRRGSIFYRKEIELNEEGAFNFVRQIYAEQDWVGDWSNDFRGARKKARKCFPRKGKLRCYLFDAKKLSAVRSLKEEIRELYEIGNHSIHVSDTSAEAMEMARLLLNENSIHHMNTSRFSYYERFTPHLEKYRKWLLREGLNVEDFCVDGSSSLAAYGIRDARDLDFLHSGYDGIKSGIAKIDSHNDHVEHHKNSINELVFNPSYHFWYCGLKFISLSALRDMKTNRGETKDKDDVELIDGLTGSQKASALNKFQTFVRLMDIRRKEFRRKLKERRRPKPAPSSKIVGLVPGRNESARIEFCLRGLSDYTDAIVYLDDCSDDDTVNVVESLAEECRVERILCKSSWYRDEPGDRNKLLRAGREIGGTHFVVIDADEAFTGNCREDEFLRKWILALKPGEQLALQWIQLWRSVAEYRTDAASTWTNRYKRCIFCDDGRSLYRSKFIHTSRIPKMKGKSFDLKSGNVGLLHFQFVDWQNLELKQKWYQYLERIRDPKKDVTELNRKYGASLDESGIELSAVPCEWLNGCRFMDASSHEVPDVWRQKQIRDWEESYGQDFFKQLSLYNSEHR